MTLLASKNQVSCDLQGDIAILHLPSGTYYGLSGVGARIWIMLQQRVTEENIVASLVEAYDVQPEKCADDLAVLLDQLTKHGLVEATD